MAKDDGTKKGPEVNVDVVMSGDREDPPEPPPPKVSVQERVRRQMSDLQSTRDEICEIHRSTRNIGGKTIDAIEDEYHIISLSDPDLDDCRIATANLVDLIRDAGINKASMEDVLSRVEGAHRREMARARGVVLKRLIDNKTIRAIPSKEVTCLIEDEAIDSLEKLALIQSEVTFWKNTVSTLDKIAKEVNNLTVLAISKVKYVQHLPDIPEEEKHKNSRHRRDVEDIDEMLGDI